MEGGVGRPSYNRLVRCNMGIVLVMMVVNSLALADDALPGPTRETLNCSADGSLWPCLLQLLRKRWQGKPFNPGTGGDGQ